MREKERMEFRTARTQISPGDGYIPMRDRFFQPTDPAPRFVKP